MKKFVLALTAAACGLGLSQAGEAAGTVNGIGGIYNPANGTFMPMLVRPAGAPVARIGKVKVVIKLTIEASIGTDQPISCDASIDSYDSSFGNSAGGSGTVVRSGTTGTLTILIPYDWTVSTATTSALSVSCSSGSSYSGGIGHTVSFSSGGFTIPTTAGTVTTESFTGSM